MIRSKTFKVMWLYQDGGLHGYTALDFWTLSARHHLVDAGQLGAAERVAPLQ